MPMTMIDKFINWMKESNRYKHLIGGAIVVIIMLLLGYIVPKEIIGVIIVAAALEFKDYSYGNKFDIIDFIITCIGGIIIYFIYKLLI